MILGLTGRAGAGKDLTYQLLTEIGELSGAALKGFGVVRRAFADPLKVSAARALGFKGNAAACIDFCNALKGDAIIKVESMSGKPYYAVLSGREYLQWYGTEAHREVFSDSFWVDQTLPPLWNPKKEMVVVTDVRFPNEAARVIENGGVIWNIIRPTGDEIIESAHASESGLDPTLIHRCIINGGTVDELRDKIVEAISHYDHDAALEVPCGCV